MRSPCTTIWSSGKACSIWRRCSSRVPSSPAIKWFPGTKHSARSAVVMVRSREAKMSFQRFAPQNMEVEVRDRHERVGPDVEDEAVAALGHGQARRVSDGPGRE